MYLDDAAKHSVCPTDEDSASGTNVASYGVVGERIRTSKFPAFTRIAFVAAQCVPSIMAYVTGISAEWGEPETSSG